MHVISTMSLKGGSGKSTIVQSLAVCAEQHGQKTLIIELARYIRANTNKLCDSTGARH